MAVAVKNSPEHLLGGHFNRLVMDSWAGVLYLLGSLGIVFYFIPKVLWEGAIGGPIASMLGQGVSVALLILAMLAGASGLTVLGFRLLGPNPPHGIRAGIFAGLVEVLLVVWITCAMGSYIEARLGAENAAIGVVVTLVVGVVLCVLAGMLFLRPQFEQRLIQVEDQGWFRAESYKRGQGLRVRRGTTFGILVLVACGIITMLRHNMLAAMTDLAIQVPFTTRSIVLLPDVRFTLPLVLAAAGLWLAYRVVNFPTFADFLIATEAELNKVSWTTRKRLIQDTIVVLVTVILLTVFLFLVDQLWAWGLKRVGVLQIPEASKMQREQQELDW